jgi:hypothetical protein
MRFTESMPQIGAGVGFGLAIRHGVVLGYDISVPTVQKPTGVWAGSVGVVAHQDGLTAFIRRPHVQLEAMVAKFNKLVMDFYTVQSVSVSDRAIGAIGLTQYGYRLVVVGYDGLPHQSQVSDLLISTGDESFTPTDGTWFIGVKSPRLWTVASSPILVGNGWVYSQGWKSLLLPYQPNVEVEWVECEDTRGESIGVFGDYLVSQYEGFVSFSSALTEGKYQRRYMPVREDWKDISIGHQCGIGTTSDDVVYFWSTQK